MEQQFQVLHIEKRSIVSFGEERHIERGVSKISEEVVEEVEEEISEKEGENDEVFSEPGEKKNRYNRKKGYIEKEVFLPDNADPDRTHLNRELIERPTEKNDAGIEVPLTISQTIMRRIEKATGKKKVPKDRNIAMELILTGSPDTMNAMDLDTLENWCHDSIQWAKDNFGEENVVSAVLHRDEKTPHIHMFVVPIVNGPSRSTLRKRWKRQQECIKKGLKYKEYKDDNKPRLCVDDLMGSEAFYQYHDSYSSVVEKYGLQRGLKAEKGSKKCHQTSEDYNRELARKADNQEKVIEEKDKEIAEKTKELDNLTLKFQQIQEDYEQVLNDNRMLSDANNDLIDRCADLSDNLYKIITQQSIQKIPEIIETVLKEIVKEDMFSELKSFSKIDNGDYILNVLNGNQQKEFILLIDHNTSNVFYRTPTSQKWKEWPKANGSRFLDFFQVVPNAELYKALTKQLKKTVTNRSLAKGSQASTTSTASHRGGGGGGGQRPDASKQKSEINMGHGGSVNTPGSSSKKTAWDDYDNLVNNHKKGIKI